MIQLDSYVIRPSITQQSYRCLMHCGYISTDIDFFITNPNHLHVYVSDNRSAEPIFIHRYSYVFDKIITTILN